ncbi:MAG: hypothetical protein ACR2KG_02940 [Nocardioidaceae bacterium]
MTGLDADDALEAAAVQTRITRAREMLLGGRGPGVGQAEIDQLTRARPQLGGEPTPQYLAAVTRRAAIARRDADAIGMDVAVTHDRITRDLQAIRAQVGLRQTAAGAVAGAMMAIAVMVFLRRHQPPSNSQRRR